MKTVRFDQSLVVKLRDIKDKYSAYIGDPLLTPYEETFYGTELKHNNKCKFEFHYSIIESLRFNQNCLDYSIESEFRSRMHCKYICFIEESINKCKVIRRWLGLIKDSDSDKFKSWTFANNPEQNNCTDSINYEDKCINQCIPSNCHMKTYEMTKVGCVGSSENMTEIWLSTSRLRIEFRQERRLFSLSDYISLIIGAFSFIYGFSFVDLFNVFQKKFLKKDGQSTATQSTQIDLDHLVELDLSNYHNKLNNYLI